MGYFATQSPLRPSSLRARCCCWVPVLMERVWFALKPPALAGKNPVQIPPPFVSYPSCWLTMEYRQGETRRRLDGFSRNNLSLQTNIVEADRSCGKWGEILARLGFLNLFQSREHLLEATNSRFFFSRKTICINQARSRCRK